jgi:hypothetical protein
MDHWVWVLLYFELFTFLLSKGCNTAVNCKLIVVQISHINSTQNPMFKAEECHVIQINQFKMNIIIVFNMSGFHWLKNGILAVCENEWLWMWMLPHGQITWSVEHLRGTVAVTLKIIEQNQLNVDVYYRHCPLKWNISASCSSCSMCLSTPND